MKNRRRAFTVWEVLVVVAMIAMLVAILYPVFAQVEKRSEEGRARTCIQQLQQIYLAKALWQEEHEVKPGARCTRTDLLPYLDTENLRWPKCPSGGNYMIREAGKSPTCSTLGHHL